MAKVDADDPEFGLFGQVIESWELDAPENRRSPWTSEDGQGLVRSGRGGLMIAERFWFDPGMDWNEQKVAEVLALGVSGV